MSKCAAIGLVLAASIAHAQVSSPDGYIAFGAQVGLFGGMAGTVGIVDHGASSPDAPWAIAMVMAPLGLSILGGHAFDALARDGKWDERVGWGLAGVWPGAMAGMGIGMGTLLAIDPSPASEVRIGIGTASLALGALLGYAVFEALGSSRRPGWVFALAWLGLVMGEMMGIVASSSDVQSSLLLLGAGLSAVGHTALAALAFQ